MIPFDGEKRVEVTHDSALSLPEYDSRKRDFGPSLAGKSTTIAPRHLAQRRAVVLKHVHGNSM